MIKHVVVLAFAPLVEESTIKRVLDKLGELRYNEVPQILSFSYGRNCSGEGLEHGFNYAFIMEFADEIARDYYVSNSKHKDIARHEIFPLLANGANSAIVIDYKC